MKKSPRLWLSELKFTKHNDYEIPNQPLLGKSVVIYGGGPSLTPELAKEFQAYPHIVTNNAYQLVSSPTVAVALDRRYFDWHGRAMVDRGFIIVTACREGQFVNIPRDAYHRMKKDREATYPPEPGILTGTNSGHAACALAFSLGANNLFLLGFDMGFVGERTHWHSGHPVPASQANYETRFRPRLEKLARIAETKGQRIAALTQTQADIPRLSPKDAREILEHENGMDNATPPTTLP